MDMIALFVIFGLVLILGMAVAMVAAQAQAKKRAWKLLKEEHPDPAEIRKVMSALGRSTITKDDEATVLMHRLSEKL